MLGATIWKGKYILSQLSFLKRILAIFIYCINKIFLTIKRRKQCNLNFYLFIQINSELTETKVTTKNNQQKLLTHMYKVSVWKFGHTDKARALTVMLT